MEFEIASLHKFRNCPVPRLRSSVCTSKTEAPPKERAQLHQHCEIQSLLGTPPSRAIRCVKLFLNGWLKKATIDPYNSKTRAQVIQSRTSWHSMLKSKKEKRTRRFANQAFARCHPEAETRNRRGCYKAEERILIFRNFETKMIPKEFRNQH